MTGINENKKKTKKNENFLRVTLDNEKSTVFDSGVTRANDEELTSWTAISNSTLLH